MRVLRVGLESAKARGRNGGRKKAHTTEQIKAMMQMVQTKQKYVKCSMSREQLCIVS